MIARRRAFVLVALTVSALAGGCAAPTVEDDFDATESAATSTDPSVDVRGAMYVDTGTFSVAVLGSSRSPVLQTSGVVPCVAVALHDARAGVGALAHIHPSQDAERSVLEIVRRAREAGLDPRSSVAHVAGGMEASGSRELVAIALATLEREGIALASKDVLGETRVRSLQVNLRTGVVAPYVERNAERREAVPYDGELVLFRPAP